MKLLRRADVAKYLQVTSQCITNWRANQSMNFPKPFTLGTSTPYWDEADLDRWLQERKGVAHGNNEGATEGIVTA